MTHTYKKKTAIRQNMLLHEVWEGDDISWVVSISINYHNWRISPKIILYANNKVLLINLLFV